MSDLFDRLRNLGLKKDIPQPKNQTTFAIEKVVDGTFLVGAQGRTFLVESQLLSGHRHGIADLFSGADITRLLEVQQIPAHKIALENIIFLDTETTGLSGGTGTYAFLVGLGRYSNDRFTVKQFFMEGPAEEASLLDELENDLSSADLLVTFNGKTFDLPLLRTRYVMNRMDAPFTEIPHLDLLHLSRRIFRNRLSDRSLGSLERSVLGFERLGEEVPGYLIPQFYFDYLQTGDARPLVGVLEHNRWDIVTMAGLLHYYADMFSPVSNLDIHSLDRIAIADIFSKSGFRELAETFYSISFEDDLPQHVVSKAAIRYSRLRKTNRDYQGAIEALLNLGEIDDIDACRELVILYGHYLRDAQASILWIDKAIDLSKSAPLPLYKRQALLEEFTKRKETMTRRIQN